MAGASNFSRIHEILQGNVVRFYLLSPKVMSRFFKIQSTDSRGGRNKKIRSRLQIFLRR